MMRRRPRRQRPAVEPIRSPERIRVRLNQEVTYAQTCPRCGLDVTGEDKDRVADAVVEHALVEQHHSLDRDVVLAHLEGVHPRERGV